MYPKLLAIIVFIALVALGTLVIRQQRLEAMHQIVRTHAQINHDRQTIWDYQVRIAGKLDPESLAKAAERQGIRLRPIIDPPVLPDMPETDGAPAPEDGRFVNHHPAPVNEVTMVQVSAPVPLAPGNNGSNAGAAPTAIMIPVVDPQPFTRPMQQRTPSQR